MKLLRPFALAAMRNNTVYRAVHVPGILNGSADALSRSRWQDFRRLAPDTDALPTAIPPELSPNFLLADRG